MVSFANGFVLFSVNLVNFQEKKRMQPTRERERERKREKERERPPLDIEPQPTHT